MRLVSIESAEENEAIREGVSKWQHPIQFCSNIKIFAEAFKQLEHFWISASDFGRDGEFYWDSTGEFFGIFADWMEGEPVLGLEDHHCGYMSIDELNINNTNHWKNGRCYSRFRFICESMPIFKELQFDAASTAVSKIDETHRFAINNSVYEISRDRVYVLILNIYNYFATNMNDIKVNISKI